MTTGSLRIGRYFWLIIALAAAVYVIYWLRGVIVPFIIGGALAYILYPFVEFLEKIMPWRRRYPGLSRFVAILTIFGAIAGAIAAGLIVVIPPLVREFQEFIQSLPQLIATARATVESWNELFVTRVPEDIRLQIEDALRNAGTILVGAVQNILVTTITTVSTALSIIIGLAILPLFLYYVLKDREKLVDGLVRWFPPHVRHHARNVIIIVNRVLSSYVRAQLFLGFVVGLLVFIGLTILDVRFAIILAVTAGLFELVPIIGPWLGAIPGILVVLATSPENLLWVALLYVGVQMVENTFLVPRIQSGFLDLHPIAIMVILIIGSELAGLWGVILGPPLVAAAKEVMEYFRLLWYPEEPDTQASIGQEIAVVESEPTPEPVAPEPGSDDNSA